MSQVTEFYSGTNVLVTGVTGFLGLAVVEKLLRTCPDVGTIYCLLRSKKNKDVASRLEDVKKSKVFETLAEQGGADRLKKLIGVAGDVSQEQLGLSAEDEARLQADVNVVFHCAATLDFEAKLKTTVEINLLGTRRVLQFSEKAKNIRAVVHVSSAYVNSNRTGFLEEVLYPVSEQADKVISLATSLSDEALDELTPRILGSHPNTYTFTKALAEYEVAQAASKFPVAIVRPSMITCTWKEPVPGWTNSKNGPTGFFMGAAKGVVRRLPVGKDLIYDYIPVDSVVNQMLVVAWDAAKNKSREVRIFHCTSSTCNPFRWKMIEAQIDARLRQFPLKSAVWYPTLKLLPSLLLFRISSIFVHFLPAYILDTVVRLTGGRAILVRLHTNVNQSLSRLAPFIFQEWLFDNVNTIGLAASLGGKDKDLFNFDIRTLDWDKYFGDLTKGVRRYLNKEEPQTLPAALRKDEILFYANIGIQVAVFSFLWWLAAVLTGSSMLTASWALPLFYGLFCFL